jgi:hypothetical protein
MFNIIKMDFTPPVKNNEAPEAIIQPSLKP